MLGSAELVDDTLAIALSVRQSGNTKARQHFGTLLKGSNFVQVEVQVQEVNIKMQYACCEPL